MAARIREQVAGEVAALDAKPGLATILVGDDPASAVYVRMKREDSAEVGIESFHHELGADVSADELAGLIRDLNADDAGARHPAPAAAAGRARPGPRSSR